MKEDEGCASNSCQTGVILADVAFLTHAWQKNTIPNPLFSVTVNTATTLHAFVTNYLRAELILQCPWTRCMVADSILENILAF